MKARQVVAHTTDVEQLRAAQAVLLPALASATLEQTAAILGVGRATVPRLQARFRQSVRPRARRLRWGGRRKALLSIEQEKQFLASTGRTRISKKSAFSSAAMGTAAKKVQRINSLCMLFSRSLEFYQRAMLS